MNILSRFITEFTRFFGSYIPFTDPVLILSMVLLIILFAPLVFRRFRIPGIIGLILAGVIIGPNTLHLIEKTTSFDLFSNTGLLYIMFLAGLEMDMHEFKLNRNKSIVFGAFTFFIPITIGFFVCVYVLHYPFWAALLLASMFSTHTLLSYPIVSHMGIIKNRAVQVTFGGTIITDSAVLILLGVITNLSTGNASAQYWLMLVLLIAILVVGTLYLLPKLSKWFFRHIEGQGGSQYLFVLAMMFLSAFVADLAGVKAIVGAFLAGLAFNKIIPHNSILMNRLIFIGNTLFIPFFLISAGMLVDLRLFFAGTQELIFAGILSSVALITKFFAAEITGFIYKYTKYERRIIYGLSASHAAATLAVIKVGYDIGLLDQHAINGTVILILITCLVSSFVTERAARQIAITDKDVEFKLKKKAERILIPIANPENLQRLMEFSFLIKDEKSTEPIYPLTVVEDADDAGEKINSIKKAIDTITEQIIPADTKIEILKKVDLNIVDGIVRTAKAYSATHIVISNRATNASSGFLFGTVYNNLLEKTQQAVFLAKIIQPLNSFKRVLLVFTQNALLEASFRRTCDKIFNLLKQVGGRAFIYADENTLQEIKKIAGDKNGTLHQYHRIDDFDSVENTLEQEIFSDDLVFIVNARKQTVSYNFAIDNLQKAIAKNREHQSLVILYPEVGESASSNQFDDFASNPASENIEKIKGKISGIFKKQ
ncbi:MAG: cation:proton antiporter [Bacteroidetes bacterium]|nr:cation:proton antiporter [Bacteroidota bacterium]